MWDDRPPHQHTAVEERTKFKFGKRRHMLVALALPGEERFQISGDNSIERTLFRIARPVYGVDGHGRIAVCNRRRIRLHNRDSNLRDGLPGKSGWSAIT